MIDEFGAMMISKGKPNELIELFAPVALKFSI
jgi:hypothetical protein